MRTLQSIDDEIIAHTVRRETAITDLNFDEAMDAQRDIDHLLDLRLHTKKQLSKPMPPRRNRY